MPDPSALMKREDVIASLWPKDAPPFSKTWVILDCARDERILGAIEKSRREKCCLFAGELSYQVRQVAPHLVHLEPGDGLARFIIERGWGNSWGIFFTSNGSLDTLRKHFRKFLRVSGPDGRNLLFRYYDPRVLRTFLPTCGTADLTQLFGAVDRFMAETEDGAGTKQYAFNGRALTGS